MPIKSKETVRPLLAERTEDLSDKEVLELYQPSNFDDQVAKLLMDGIPRLLVGSRGTGKSMLMRYVAAKLNGDPSLKECLGVYVNFSDYLMLDPVRFSSEDAPAVFRAWVTTKILAACMSNSRIQAAMNGVKLKVPPALPDDFSKLLLKLQASLAQVQREALSNNPSQRKLSAALEPILTLSTESVVEIIGQLLKPASFRRIVLLFDEAAHTFSPPYQVEFFRYFRSLRANFIAAKAAVYPGSTAFGPSFDVGHDAKVVLLDRDEQSRNYLPFMRGILERRLNEDDWSRLSHHSDLLDVLLYSATGNPRAVVSMADRLLEGEGSSRKIHRRSYKDTVTWYSNEVLWPLHQNLGRRVPSLRADIDLGRALVESIVVRDLAKLNANTHSKTPYFALAHGLPIAVTRALSLLQYAGIVVPRGSPRRGRGNPLDRYLLNLSICIEGRVLFGEKGAVFPVSATDIAHLSLATYKQYQAPEEFESLAAQHPPSLPPCAKCGSPRASPDIKFCGNCGAPLIASSIFNDVVKLPVESLDLPQSIRNRLRTAGFITIGDVLRDEDGRQIRSIKFIKDVRFERIRAAAMEQLSA